MKLKFDKIKLSEIMEAFYVLTKIKIIIFDKNHNIILSYPETDCKFCALMKKTEIGREKCNSNDMEIFEKCRKKSELIVYTCHAGLVEGCAPLKYGEIVIGYIMFGQVSDLPSRETLNQSIEYICKAYNLDSKIFINASKSITVKKSDIIMSAAKIFSACTSYIIINEMLIPENDKIISQCDSYINDNIDTASVDSLIALTGLSRTKLYETFKKSISKGVSEFIRDKRLAKAEELLKKTDLSIYEISVQCGFNDYNYFSRIFKNKYKKSPKSFRMSL